MPQYKSQRISPNHSAHLRSPDLIKAVPGRPIRIVVTETATAGTFGVYAAPTVSAASSGNAIFEKTSDYPVIGTVLDLEWVGPGGLVINPGIDGHVSVTHPKQPGDQP
jgi:hypothetical protein